MKYILDLRFWILDCCHTPGNPKSKIQNPKFVLHDPLFVLLTMLFLVGLPAIVMACPACKEALFDPSQLHQKLSAAKGYALSIGLLLSVPSALVIGITWLIVRAARDRRR